jgi:hypothetical protein
VDDDPAVQAGRLGPRGPGVRPWLVGLGLIAVAGLGNAWSVVMLVRDVITGQVIAKAVGTLS